MAASKPIDEATATALEELATKAPEGLILPPLGTRNLVEKTADIVVRRGPEFEAKIKENSKANFLLQDDPYYPYYKWRSDEIKAGRGINIAAAPVSTEVSFKGREVRKGPEKPEDFAFSARTPNMAAQDMDIVKLTALFVAKNGRSWMTTLSQREAGNYQFDFLRQQHSMYQYFSRLVDQYTDLLTGDTVDEGRPQKKRISELEANAKNRFRILERARKRAEYVKWEEEQKEAKEDAKRKEEVAFAQIDWHDFVVVETVVFTTEDQNVDLPPPQRLNDLQSASLEQKAAMSIAPGRRLEEAMPDFDNYENYYTQAMPPPAPAVKTPTPQQQQPQQAYPPPQQTEEESRVSQLQADRARARAAQEAAKSQPSNIKIRSNYVPAAQARKATTTATSICPKCNLPIPNDHFDEHMRIEMLDPQWREQAKVAQQRSSTTNLSTADVASNLKRLASQRSDVFDPVTGRELGVEEAERRKRVEMAVPGVVQQGNGGGDASRPTDVQEQIRQIHERARQG